MKKHAFKRITAMVLVFVMCVFLMPTNSLGVKAVTADDVLVEESQVSSEIGAENPASDVEVITSEEEDLSAEELTSDEVVDEASEETGDIEPLDILSENGTILLEGETTDIYNLSYGTTTEEGFEGFDAVSARIDEIGNADGVYTITCVQPAEDEWETKWGYINNNFPTEAAELIFCGPTESSGLNYQARECVTTDIKLTFNTYVAFPAGCDLNEVVMNGSTITVHGVDGEAAPSIETLSLNYSDVKQLPSSLNCSTEINIGTCNFDTYSYLFGMASYDDNGNPSGADVHFIIDTINSTESTFRLNVDDWGFAAGYVVLTTSDDIALNQIKNEDATIWNLELVDNGDGTTSVKLAENKTVNFELCYDSVTEEYKTYEQVCERIDELASFDTEYTVIWKKEAITETTNWVYKRQLPTYAEKITFICEDDSAFYHMGLGGFRFEYVDAAYPLEFQGCYVWLSGNFTDVTISDCDIVHLGCGGGVAIDTVSLPANATLYVQEMVEVDEITYTGTVSEESKIIYAGSQYENDDGSYTTVYPRLKVGDITLADVEQIISLEVQWGSLSYPTVFELTNAGVSSAWWNVKLTSAEYIEGYSLERIKTADGAGIYQYVAGNVPEIILTYNGVTEYFTCMDDVIDRIENIDNAEYDYVIMPYNAGDMGDEPMWDMRISDFPEKAKSLTVENVQSEYVSLSIGDSDGIVNYPVTFTNVCLMTDTDLQTKGMSVINAGYCYMYNNLIIDGTFHTEGSHVLMNAILQADTLSCGRISKDYHISFTGTGSHIVNNLIIPTGQTMKITLNGNEEGGTSLTVNNYSNDIERLDVFCVSSEYEEASKVDEDGCYTFYTKKIEPFYYVTDVSGNNFGSFRNWSDLLERFDEEGDKTRPYTIKVVNDKVIGKLPSNASKITLVGDNETAAPVIKCSSSKLTMTTELEIRNAKLEYGAEGKPVNIEIKGKKLVLDNVQNVGNIVGGNGELTIITNADVAKIDKVNYMQVIGETRLDVSGNISNVKYLDVYGEMYALGDISVGHIWADDLGELHYNIGKKLAISDYVYGQLNLYPQLADGNPAILEEGTAVIDTCSKADITAFMVNGLAEDKVIYRSGNVIKVGTPVITVFSNYYGDWTTADASEGMQFATINDAIDYVNNQYAGQYVIRLEKDVISTETIKTIQGDVYKEVLISTSGDDMATLTFKGTFIVEGANVEVRNVALCNSTKANASVTLKNGANLTLCNTAVNALTVPAGTSVTIANLDSADVDVVINGTAKCAGEVIMADNAVLWCRSTLTTGDFTLNGEYAEVRILTGKAFTINGNVNIGEDSLVCINRVDKEGNLATIKAGTAMVTAENAVAGQFYTQNIMTGTEDVSWLLTKSGKVIKTAGLVAYAYVSGERGEFNPQFASFNEAKEYVAAQTDGEEYVIELLCDTSGADLTDLPENLLAIVKSESATATSVKLTTSLDVTLSTNLVLDGVNLSAAKKTIYANDYELYIDNNGGITAARAKELDTINVNSGTVTFTAKDSTINNVEMGVDGTFKCPQFTGYAMG